MHASALNLHQVVVFLIAAGVVVPLLKRCGINPVLGFLAAGLVVGPFGLARWTADLPWLAYGVISDLEGVRALAELGVVFLLFMIGLELSPERLWSMRRSVFGLGAAQVIATGAVICGIALLFGNSLPAAVVLGAGFALSSTAIVMGLMIEGRRLGTPTGQTAFAILLLQDLAVLPILLLVASLAGGAGDSVVAAFGLAVAEAVIAVAAIVLLGRLFIRPLFHLVGSGASREMFLAAVLLVVIGTSVATEKMGLSMALGAFLAGLLFSETEYRHAVEVDIEPFKGILLALFFVSVGMGIDLGHLVAQPAWIAGSVVGLFGVKAAIIYGLARLSHRGHAVALETALLLGQGGEFAFVIVGLAATLGLLPEATAQFMLIVTGLSMMATPLVASLARSLALASEPDALHGDGFDQAGGSRLEGHVAIVGYGRVGQLLALVLDRQEICHVAVDNDPQLLRAARQRGSSVVFGDARQPHVLTKLGIDRAAALVVTMDDPAAAERIVDVARKRWPLLQIYARARDSAHASRLLGQGATDVIPETIEASLQLGEVVLAGCGVPEDAARRIIDLQRAAEREKVQRQKPEAMPSQAKS